jgi:putative endonuclease
MVETRAASVWFVYIASNKSHQLYVGVTTDPERRIREHRSGKYPSSFTARYVFDRLVYSEAAASEEDALRREQQLKGWRREKKVALIQAKNPNWLDITPSWLDALRLD